MLNLLATGVEQGLGEPWGLTESVSQIFLSCSC